MDKSSLELVNTLLKSLSKLDYIKPGEVPNIDLYMDQVTTFMDDHLSDVKRYTDDKILTKTMINNYAKNDLLPPPIKKKYSKDHIYILIFIYYFKNILSISDIEKLLKPLTTEFFGDEACKPGLDRIYEIVYGLEKEQLSNLSKDIYREFKHSQDVFNDVENDDHKDFLQLFSFVAMLSWDIYIKKNIILGVLDEISKKTDNFEKEDKKSKAEKSEKEEKKKQ
ncbi:MAG: DUF1836 domain-containing protein [Lachnospiraceae bacterium]